MSAALRARVAAAVRELGHAFVAHDAPDDELTSLAEALEDLVARVSAGPDRQPGPDPDLVPPAVADRLSDAAQLYWYLAGDSVVSGAANPMGLGARYWLEGETAVMEVVFGRAFEGAPGRTHGGILATLIDETMGTVLGHHGVFALTAWLKVTYRSAAPLGEPITARAWLAERDGRKLTIGARVEASGKVVADAEALFIAVDPRRFLESPPES